jgi:hypothetical protein
MPRPRFITSLGSSWISRRTLKSLHTFSPSGLKGRFEAHVPAGSEARADRHWHQDDYDVLENSVIVGRIFKVPIAPRDRHWMWASGHNGHIRRAAHATSRRARPRWQRSPNRGGGSRHDQTRRRRQRPPRPVCKGGITPQWLRRHWRGDAAARGCGRGRGQRLSERS